MELNDHMPGIHFNLAVVYAKQNNGPKALEHIDLALKHYLKLQTFYWVGKARDTRRLILRKFKIKE